MNGPALYVSDLDGTLLRSDGRLSPYARESLNALIAGGLAFTAASARSAVTMRLALAGVTLRLPVIAFNGTYLSDLESGEHVFVRHLAPTLAGELLELVRRHDCEPVVTAIADGREWLHYEHASEGLGRYLAGRAAAADPRLRPPEPLWPVVERPVACFTIIDRPSVLAPLRAAIDERFAADVVTYQYENIYDPGWYWLTLHDRRANKADAIDALRERCGLDGGPLVVFGDQSNDVAMLRRADRAVVMGNAADEIKAHAHEVIGTNDEDSVVRYLERRAGAT